MAEPTSHKLLTVEEYPALEKSATVKHEYVAGTIHAMVGTTKRHNRIALNIASLLLDAARGGSCRVYVSDVKVRTEDIIYYPDVMVACGPEGADPLVEDNPCLVVDVVLPSIETTDRREKLAAYKRMPGLEAYLIISQNRKWVERHFRAEDGTWRRANLLDEGRVPIPCPECELSPAGIYEGLE